MLKWFLLIGGLLLLAAAALVSLRVLLNQVKLKMNHMVSRLEQQKQNHERVLNRLQKLHETVDLCTNGSEEAMSVAMIRVEKATIALLNHVKCAPKPWPQLYRFEKWQDHFDVLQANADEQVHAAWLELAKQLQR